MAEKCVCTQCAEGRWKIIVHPSGVGLLYLDDQRALIYQSVKNRPVCSECGKRAEYYFVYLPYLAIDDVGVESVF